MRLEDLTVIVPTRNEAANIRAFLESLPKTLALIVVDAGDDATADIVANIRPEHSLVLRHLSPISEARQRGAEAASTPWLLFTDADVQFPLEYFERLVHQPPGDAVYGPKLSRDKFQTYYRWFAYGQRLSHWLGIPAATGSNILLKREVLTAVGGFDPELSCNEDSELLWRVKRAGYQVAYNPRLAVYARDHRRLERGLWRKTAHSISRCLLLYWNLLPARWRRHDWGYWTPPRLPRD
jgi:glycosyltransferase involved in cell wall biosynthesis